MNFGVGAMGLLVAVASVATGCGSIVTGGRGDDCPDDNLCEEGGGGTGGAGQGGAGGAVSASGVAVPWEDLAGVAEAPAGTLLLAFGSEPEACADPLADLPACTAALTWRAEIPLPAHAQVAGAVIDLAELQGVGYGPYVSESQGEGDGVCSGGAGTLDGVLEVLAVDAASITIRLSGSSFTDAPLGGERTLLRCGGAPPPPAESAVALTQTQLDALFNGGGTGGSAGTGGSPPDPASDYLFVFLDTSAQPAGLSCSDPYASNQGCAFDRSVMIVSLPPWAQAVGSYAIGPDVGLSTSESGGNGDGTCWGGGSGGWDEGTVDVLAIDATSVQVRVNGASLGNAEGTAARCP